MSLSSASQKIVNEINRPGTKLGDLRIIAKKINKDHEIAKELWSTGKLHPRLLAILIMDKKELDSGTVDKFISDIEGHPYEERNQLADWLMANQLTKDKKTISMMESWENSPSTIKRRLFWYYQGRLRWMGQESPANTKQLLDSIEKNILKEEPEVQWAMNFTAGWMGIFNKELRQQCIRMGEKYGLYKDEMVSKNCTPNYLPEFIRIESKKRNL